MASALSIQPGFIQQNDGTVAAGIRAIITKRFLSGQTEPLSLGKIAAMMGCCAEDVVEAAKSLQARERIAVTNRQEISINSTIQPVDLQLRLFVSNGLFDEQETERQNRNPLGFFIGQDYPLADGSGKVTFKGWNEDDDQFTFFFPGAKEPMRRGDLVWAKNLVTVPGAQHIGGKLPGKEELGIELPELDAEGLRVYRCGAERFAELLRYDSAKKLAAKNPSAEEIVTFADVSYVVTGVTAEVVDTDSNVIEPVRIYLTPCTVAKKGDKEGVFKLGKDRYVLGSPSDRVVVLAAPVEEVIQQEDQPAKADPLAWILQQIDRGFICRGEDGVADVYLKPKSFQAARTQLAPDSDETVLTFSYDGQRLEVTQDSSNGGFEIDGYEEDLHTATPIESREDPHGDLGDDQPENDENEEVTGE